MVLGLAHPRAGWFSELARWTTTAAVPIDFLKCVSAEEVRARLHDGRTYSALLVGGDVASLDRDLVDTARACGAAVLVVGRHGRRDWKELGVSALLPEVLERHELLAALTEHAPPVTSVEQLVVADPDDTDGSWRGRLVAVTGPGGAGVSVSAMALAQGLASDASNRGLVLLADLALDAEQSMLHDARELVPGVQELVEGHRGGRLPPDEIRALVFDAAGRGYHLLLGLRRHRDWTAIRPRALEAGLDGLLRCYRLVVADIDPDLEGEAETGSLDIGDRNLMARTVAERADLVVVVGTDGVKGLHALARTIRAMLDGGVPVDRIVPTVTRAPRSPRR
ncbi:MAG: hypothetical protein ACE5GB_06380, partial [Acidimicrobiales bacterium]